jgi:hypothetical protein
MLKRATSGPHPARLPPLARLPMVWLYKRFCSTGRAYDVSSRNCLEQRAPPAGVRPAIETTLRDGSAGTCLLETSFGVSGCFSSWDSALVAFGLTGIAIVAIAVRSEYRADTFAVARCEGALLLRPRISFLSRVVKAPSPGGLANQQTNRRLPGLGLQVPHADW